MKAFDDYTLYLETEEANDWIESLKKDVYINDEPEAHIIENGVILPLKYDSRYRFSGVGGVCDANGSFIAGHKSSSQYDETTICVTRGYPIPPEIQHMDETVVYGGIWVPHYGHFITECLSRMWWFVENPCSRYKFVFIFPKHWQTNQNSNSFIEFFLMLGIKKDDIVILEKPMSFKSVIVPDQATCFMEGYNAKASKIYNAIRDSVMPSELKKVYFTRTRLQNPGTVNEEYFEDFFRLNGYAIIAPEKLSIREQVAIMAGVDEFACVSGTLHHHILFAREGIKATILNRFSFMHDKGNMRKWMIRRLGIMHWINHLKKANCVYVDVSANFLPHRISNSVYLLMPNANWKSYIADYFNDFVHNEDIIRCRGAVADYIERWCKKLPETAGSYSRNWMTLVDFVERYHKYILESELDCTIKDELKSTFDDARQKILYGAGFYGGQALNHYGFERVYAFTDMNKHGSEYLGKQVINPSQLCGLNGEYDIIICAWEHDGIQEYLQGIGVDDFRLFYLIKANDSNSEKN